MDELYFGWDYVSLLFEMEPDRFHTYLERIEQVGREKLGSETFMNNSKVRALGAASGPTRRYVFNAWGRAARIIAYLPMEWDIFVRRLDIKAWDAGMTGAQFDALAHTLMVNPNPYNITTYHSKPRRKTDDRDAGGKGFAIGSHKSDLRVSTYSRAGSPYCLEFQCRDKMLRRLIGQAHAEQPASAGATSFWVAVKQLIEGVGQARLSRALAAVGIGSLVPTGPVEELLAALDEQDRERSAEHQQVAMDPDYDGDYWPAPEGHF